MTSAFLAQAEIVVVNDDHAWHCPNCNQKLAQIIGGRLVLRTRERLISMRVDHEPDQVRWRCGKASVLGSVSAQDSHMNIS